MSFDQPPNHSTKKRLRRWLFSVVAIASSLSAARASLPERLPEHLWISSADLAARRAAVMESPLLALVEDAERTLELLRAPRQDGVSETRSQIDRLEALVIAASFRQDPDLALQAVEPITTLLSRPFSDLGKAQVVLHSALAFAFLRQYWPEETQKAVAQELFDYGLSFQKIGKGNPDNPYNNWWGVTHSAAALCFLAVRDTIPESQPYLDLECERVASYLLNYGDNGHYYEGTEYGMYSFSYWAPLLLACRASLQRDLAAHAPGVARIGTLVYMLTVPPAPDASPGSLGARIFWNDDSGEGFAPDLCSLFFPLADPDRQGALKGAFDALFARPSNPTYLHLNRKHGNGMWTLLYYPLDLAAPTYGTGLPNALIDHKTGLALFRNRYLNSHDTVFGIYAKSYHGGGHVQADAGSFRLLSLGDRWCYAGGQAKPQARYQNTLLKNGVQPGAANGHEKATGKIAYFATNPTGGSVSVDLSEAYDTPRARRHFAIAFPPAAEVEAVISIYDEIIERPEDPASWTWPLTLGPNLDFVPAQESNGFELHASSGIAGLQARFYSPIPHEFLLQESPTSSRTFADGNLVHYPSVRYVSVTQEEPSAPPGFFSVLTLQQGPPPSVTFEGDGTRRQATIGETLQISLDNSKWFKGPLRITPLANEEP